MTQMRDTSFTVLTPKVAAAALVPVLVAIAEGRRVTELTPAERVLLSVLRGMGGVR